MMLATAAFSALASLRRRLQPERGATAVEYAIMVALIAAVIILAVVFLGQQTSDQFSCTANSIDAGDQLC